ncbi:SulP family inorganic anion transporter [Hyphobacterium sp. CCMP332]|nr:SulP family inorganic anion transporter [Hyphobacterium sp. CCMP332]
MQLNGNTLKSDFSSSIVVFLVALPLCLGIALASGAPLFSGIISGILGGIVVGSLSGSNKSVSGPAAGLAIIVLNAIETLGAWEVFIMAVVLAGLLQIVLYIFKAGFVAELFPNSVIKGMLAAIGIVITLKQIPHALGRDTDYEGDYEFFQIADGENTFSEILRAIETMSLGALIITVVSLAILIFWEKVVSKQKNFISSIPGALVVVILGISLNEFYHNYFPSMELLAEDDHLVTLPIFSTFEGFKNALAFPDFSALLRLDVYIVAITLAIVASLETLLNVEATDKIDPEKRSSDTNKELLAQGVGNTISGLIGGLPITSVIVRSSANVYSGAKSRLSTILHGFWLVSTIALLPEWLNKIPLASLAAILFIVGYKLASFDLFKSMYRKGKDQFYPFLITIVAIVFTDLLIGICIGLVIGFIFVVFRNYHSALTVVKDDNYYLFRFNKDVSFMNKAKLKTELGKIPDNSFLILDAHKAQFIDNDIIDILEDFSLNAKSKNITIEYIHIDLRKSL